MHIHEIIPRDVEVIRPDAMVQEAARIMDKLNVGPLPVCDGERLVGMLTDRDFVVRGAASGLDPTTPLVSELMTRDVTYCSEHDDVREAARLMEQHQIRGLVVLNEGKQLVGIVSLGDLPVETGNDALAGETLQQISAPAQLVNPR